MTSEFYPRIKELHRKEAFGKCKNCKSAILEGEKSYKFGDGIVCEDCLENNAETYFKEKFDSGEYARCFVCNGVDKAVDGVKHDIDGKRICTTCFDYYMIELNNFLMEKANV